VNAEFCDKARRFRELLNSNQLEFIMEAHNGLSARIVERAGFRGIWGSGLSISASLGVRDNNEASWTQVLEVLEFMVDATSIPIMMDGDTGFGNFNNMRRLVRKLCNTGVAAVCIEDKLFPKTNSFIGDAQPLAEIEEFCGKIKAGKDSQLDDNFSIVARLEALISGWGMDEALRRAERFHAAGADAVLIHSKKSGADEILGFMQAWGNRCPVVIVPTMYYATPTEQFRRAGVSMVVWANHNLRAAIAAMRTTSRRIFEEKTLVNIEDSLPSVKEVFDLQENQELMEAERRYLPSRGRTISGIVLATSRGTPLGALTEDRPKCMVDVRGQPLLTHLSKVLRDAGVAPITVVRGYRKEAIDLKGLDYIDNDDFARSGELGSLVAASANLRGECLIMYGDMLFRRFILDDLLESPTDITVVVDGQRDAVAGPADLVRCSAKFLRSSAIPREGPVLLHSVGRHVSRDRADGEWIGLLRVKGDGCKRLAEEIARSAAEPDGGTARLPDVLERLIARGEKIGVVYISGYWMDVDTMTDVARAQTF